MTCVTSAGGDLHGHGREWVVPKTHSTTHPKDFIQCVADHTLNPTGGHFKKRNAKQTGVISETEGLEGTRGGKQKGQE